VEDLASRLTNEDAAATAPQKTRVAAGPRTEPPGSLGLVERTPSIQSNGSRHCVFVLGPAGPLL
jgi:hypothetical protein